MEGKEEIETGILYEQEPEMKIVCSGGITLPPLIVRVGEPDGEQPAGL